MSEYVCDNCHFRKEMDDEEYDGKCPVCGCHHGEWHKEDDD